MRVVLSLCLIVQSCTYPTSFLWVEILLLAMFGYLMSKCWFEAEIECMQVKRTPQIALLFQTFFTMLFWLLQCCLFSTSVYHCCLKCCFKVEGHAGRNGRKVCVHAHACVWGDSLRPFLKIHFGAPPILLTVIIVWIAFLRITRHVIVWPKLRNSKSGNIVQWR